jgi:hypothetical protein
MAYLIEAGIQVSLDNVNWQKLTDHNREPISVSTELIESQARMANGRMRKYVVSQKNTISASWSYVPSKTSETADLNHGAAWLDSFYRANVGSPIYLKVVESGLNSSGDFITAKNTSKVYTVFMTNFSKTTINRTKISDYVSMSIDFTEI